ncbi:hypothetical protein [Streptomyces sp. NPDC047315]
MLSSLFCTGHTRTLPSSLNQQRGDVKAFEGDPGAFERAEDGLGQDEVR